MISPVIENPSSRGNASIQSSCTPVLAPSSSSSGPAAAVLGWRKHILKMMLTMSVRSSQGMTLFLLEHSKMKTGPNRRKGKEVCAQMNKNKQYWLIFRWSHFDKAYVIWTAIKIKNSTSLESNTLNRVISESKSIKHILIFLLVLDPL